MKPDVQINAYLRMGSSDAGGISHWNETRETGPMMACQHSLLGHVAGILRAQPTVGPNEWFSDFED
eukprot:12892797-Prorocentrum_lima.AAC.1